LNDSFELWPGLPSTYFSLKARKEGVDTRDKRGHDTKD